MYDKNHYNIVISLQLIFKKKKEKKKEINRISQAEEQISELEEKVVETVAEEQDKVKIMKRTEDRLKNL